MITFGNLVDLRGLEFDDLQGSDNKSSWIQAMPIGNYVHPVHGPINITPERVQRFADNVNNGVRGQVLDIDYDHKQHNGKAAGWVKEAEARPNGLWLLVEWVQDAYNDIKNGAYRYFSPEFQDEWKHPSLGKTFKDVLFGGGITNRPFLKGILPLNLSEMFAESNTISEGNDMFTDEQRVALREKFGLAPDADDNAIMDALLKGALEGSPEGEPPAAADESAVADTNSATDADNADTVVPSNNGTPSQVTVKFSEDEVKQLSENPTTKKLFEALEENTKKLKEMRDDSLISSVSKMFSEKGYALPPTVEAAMTDVIKLSENDQFTGSVVQMLSKIAEVGLIKLGEEIATSPNQHRFVNEDSTKKLSEAAEKFAKEHNVSYGDAMVSIVRDNPEAYDAHRLGN